MIRRSAGAVFVACALFALSPAAASAEVPGGPRLAVVKRDARFHSELFTAGPLGSAQETLYGAGVKQTPMLIPFSPPIWSPDGSRIAFVAVTGEDRLRFASFPKTAIAVESVEGGKPTVLPGTTGATDPVFSPDGTHLVFAKERERWRPNGRGGGRPAFDSVSVWLYDLATSDAVQLTPWRDGLRQAPSSFSPDGARLAFTRETRKGKPQAVTMALDGAGSEVLATDASEPIYSPDGSRVSFLRGPTKIKTLEDRQHSETSIVFAHLTDIYVERVDGSELRRLTATPSAVEFDVSWDPSGQRLAYTQLKPFSGELAVLGFGDAIREVNADGSCGTEIFSAPKETYVGAAWEPGSGREAGPLAC